MSRHLLPHLRTIHWEKYPGFSIAVSLGAETVVLVSKKLLPSSVDRNMTKRRLREGMRQSLNVRARCHIIRWMKKTVPTKKEVSDLVGVVASSHA